MWNDNNEYVVPRDDWQLALTHTATKTGTIPEATSRKDLGLWGRALHTELMAKASHDALLSAFPNERPFVLTRSATAGTMKYASSSWSGDNVTSWNSMRGANAVRIRLTLFIKPRRILTFCSYLLPPACASYNATATT